MLNKIKIIGKAILKEEKDKDEESSLGFTVDSQETENELSESEPERGEPWFYFSLLVPLSSGSLTALRCIAQGEMARKIKEELEGNEVIEVQGFLRNDESGKVGKFEDERKKRGWSTNWRMKEKKRVIDK